MFQSWTSSFTLWWRGKNAVLRIPILYVIPYKVISCKIVDKELVIRLRLK